MNDWGEQQRVKLLRAAGGSGPARLARRALFEGHFQQRHLRPIWRSADEFQGQSPASARRSLAIRLQEVLQYFGQRGDALPEWREAARARDPDDVWRRWNELPIVTKADLNDRFPAAEIRQRFDLRGVIRTSGGSTGEPTAVFHDLEMMRSTTALRYHVRRKLGWTPGMPTIVLWGSERDIGAAASPKGKLYHALQNSWMVGGYSLGQHTVDRVLKLVSALQPAAMYGFTSLLEYVARRVVEQGVVVPRDHIRTAWSGGETLNEAQSALFEQAFGVPILDLYGGRELSSMAYQERRGDPLRVLRPFLFLEIVNEQGRPAAAGEVGRLLWTSTVCRGTPFLRYDIGDLGSYGSEDSDESGLHSLRSLQGRTGGLIRLSNGKTIGGLYWNHLMKDYPEVSQFQVGVLNKGTDLRLRLVGKGFGAGREEHMRSVLRDFLGPIPIAISWVAEIRRSRTGKLEQVVSEVA